MNQRNKGATSFLLSMCVMCLAAQVGAQDAAQSEQPASEASDEDTSGASPSTESQAPDAAHDAEGQEELEAQVAELQQSVARLQEEMAALRNLERERLAAQSSSTAPAPQKTPAEKPKAKKVGLGDRQTALQVRPTLRGEHEATPRPGNAPLDPALPHFFQLGSTGAWMKIGGYVKLDMITDSTQTASPNRLVTSSIYVDSQPEFGGPATFSMHAKQSRIHVEVRRATPIGALRLVYENDFFGDPTSPNMVYRLRHLYGQVANLLVGNTWTTFVDMDALPDTLDFEGAGVTAGVRQPQVRYTIPLWGDHAHLAFALEQPQQDIGSLPAGASARLIAPDFTVAFRVEERWGHFHLGGLARYLTYQQDNAVADEAFGWGLNLSTSLSLFGRDRVVGNLTVGQGIGHYAQDFAPGYAATVETDGNLHALTAWGGLAGYLHHWSERWRTQISYGYLKLKSIAGQPALTYDHTHYAQANLIWSITPELSIGVEGLYGEFTTRDLSRGDDYRGQASLQYSVF